MKTFVLSSAVLALLSACASHTKSDGLHAGDLLLGASLQRAIIAQSTVYPYHFVPDAAELNALGQRDVSVLAAHLREHAGSLVVNRGSATQQLHDARVKAVLAALEQEGVPANQVAVREGLPGGDGLSTLRVIDIFDRPLVLTGAGISTMDAASTTGP